MSPHSLSMNGPGYWLRSYGLMVLWELMSLRLVVPIMMVVQIFMGAGLVVGFGFFFEQVPPAQALYFSSGATVIAVLVIGMVMAPQMVAQQKMQGTYEFIWSLPVPRITSVVASLTVWMLAATPGMILALVVAAYRYDLGLQPGPLLVPAALLTALVATSMGYAIAHAIPNPVITGLLAQVLVFVILIYSPINFPADRLPDWLQTIHSALPFEHAAVVMRASLTPEAVPGLGTSYAVLVAWAALGWAVTAWVLGRRG